jgi:dTDP-4-dehydrorhamnose 3,5-epimerase
MSKDQQPQEAAKLRLFPLPDGEKGSQSGRTVHSPMSLRPSKMGYVEGEIDGVVVTPIKAFTDQRGWLMEVYREDEIPAEIHPVMAYISQTKPGITRGPHEHVHQTDYFVFVGPGDFELCLWDARHDSPTQGHKQMLLCGQSYPCSVVVPPGVVHGYKNVSPIPGWVFNAPNRLYAGPGKREPVDEIRHEEHAESRYRIA